MIPEAVQGTYKITASTDKGEKVSHSFKIKEYGELQIPPNSVPNENSNWSLTFYFILFFYFALVLPKFEVKVSLPSVITILDREVAITICGK